MKPARGPQTVYLSDQGNTNKASKGSKQSKQSKQAKQASKASKQSKQAKQASNIRKRGPKPSKLSKPRRLHYLISAPGAAKFPPKK